MDDKLYLPTSIFLSALILAGTIFIVGSGISTQMSDLKTGFASLQVAAPAGNEPNDTQQPTGNTGTTPTPTIDLTDLEDNDPVLGDPDAPVTIIEFSDYECPFCGRFYNDTLSRIKTDYVETGKVRIIYRDFPLSFHPNAQKAAEAAECSGKQGKYWEMHDVLFENQTALSVDNLKQYASDLGLNTEQFNSCLDSGETAAEVRADFSDGAAAGVSGTPSFFVNGKLIVGAQPYDAFKAAIDAALAE